MHNERVDSRLFWVDGALLAWPSLVDRPEGSPSIVIDDFVSGADRERSERFLQAQVGLRWNVNAAMRVPGQARPLGLPVAPFRVWRRQRLEIESSLLEPISVPTQTVFGYRVLHLPRDYAVVQFTVNSTSNGAAFALAKNNDVLSLNNFVLFSQGSRTIRFRSGRVAAIAVPASASITNVEGIVPRDFIDAGEWEQVEIVGMPVDQTEWLNVGEHAIDQGPVGATTNPIDAAIERIDRGSPPIGWATEIEPGIAAPPWVAPDPAALIDEVSERLLPELREAMELAAIPQLLHRFSETMPPPASLDGTSVPGESQDISLSPVQLLQVAVASDPLAALTLGYGTNVIEGELEIPNQDNVFHPIRAQFDYMVTADFGDEVGFASLALTPIRAFLPVAPTDIAALTRLDVVADDLVELPAAQIPPVARDLDWRATSVLRWERPLNALLVRTASHVVARRDDAEIQARLLNLERPAGGPQPIAPAVDENPFIGDPQSNFIHYPDREIPIPNDPGSRQLHYAAANQNIFGLWSNWQTASTTIANPDLPPPLIVRADFDVERPASGTECPGTVSIDVLWDWTDRSPSELRIAGRMFATPNRSTTLPVGPAPAGLSRDLGAVAGEIVLSFAGDTATLASAPAGSVLSHVNDQGETADDLGPITPGARQGDAIRRYRVTVPSLTVDFASTDHVGFALWARGVERIAPNRTSTSAAPVYAYASSPLTVDVIPELVPLSSLPDADGSSHACISWPAMPGAAGYIVYGSDEATMRDVYDMDDPDLDETLSDRLTELLDAWEANPVRRPFSRLTRQAITETSMNVVLPRGTTGISTFVVLTTGLGGIESDWPSSATAGVRDLLIARATPRVARPAAPEIETLPGEANVDIAIRVNPGHRVDRIDLHRVRVDDAARDLDTMGPPVATISDGTPGWTVEVDDDGAPVEFRGVDMPGSSWRRVWYRAVAWADEQWTPDGATVPFRIAERGLISGRSEPSNAVSLELIPAGPPDLSEVLVGWPGGNVAAVELNFTSDAPLQAPLGDHRLEVIAHDSGASSPVEFSGPLASVPLTPSVLVEGVWRDSSSDPSQYRVVVNRTNLANAVDATVRIIDPRGRVTARTIRVPPGPALPEPDLSDLVLTPARGGVMLTFASTSPVRRFGASAYQLTVSARPERPGPGPGPFPLPPGSLIPPQAPVVEPEIDLRRTLSPAAQPGRLLRRDLVAERPDFDATPFDRIPDLDIEILEPGRRPVVLEVDLPDIEPDRLGRPNTEPLQVRWRRGRGTARTYVVLARFPVTRFDLTLRSPDGRVARATIESAP